MRLECVNFGRFCVDCFPRVQGYRRKQPCRVFAQSTARKVEMLQIVALASEWQTAANDSANVSCILLWSSDHKTSVVIEFAKESSVDKNLQH